MLPLNRIWQKRPCLHLKYYLEHMNNFCKWETTCTSRSITRYRASRMFPTVCLYNEVPHRKVNHEGALRTLNSKYNTDHSQACKRPLQIPATLLYFVYFHSNDALSNCNYLATNVLTILNNELGGGGRKRSRLKQQTVPILAWAG